MGCIIGTAQLPDKQADVSDALRMIAQTMLRADQLGINLVCFPECFLQGYTLDPSETAARALALDSPAFGNILKLLAGYKVAIVLGLIERFQGDFYNTAAVIQRGKLLGVYRKTHLFETNFRAGSHFPVFELCGLRVGINICYDARSEDGAAALAKQGAQVIFYPLNNRLPIDKATTYRHKHLPHLIARAQQTGCWVVSSDVIAKSKAAVGYGCSAIVNPNGQVVAKVPELTTDLVYFRI